jgi:hypothetical protein
MAVGLRTEQVSVGSLRTVGYVSETAFDCSQPGLPLSSFATVMRHPIRRGSGVSQVGTTKSTDKIASWTWCHTYRLPTAAMNGGSGQWCRQ